MNITFEYQDHCFTLTTEHSASSDGIPVLLVDCELLDVPVVVDTGESALTEAVCEAEEPLGISVLDGPYDE